MQTQRTKLAIRTKFQISQNRVRNCLTLELPIKNFSNIQDRTYNNNIIQLISAGQDTQI